MKIHILFEFNEDPWGGGNQFLKALRDYFIKEGVYEEIPDNADVILFNSHHGINKLINLKKKNSKKVFVHRLDGPIFLIRGQDLLIDKIIFELNHLISDGTIFQSGWNKQKCIELGMKRNNFETIITNAVNPKIFNIKGKIKFSKNRKIKLIATSWSSNWNKGFDVYKWLDKNLNFNKYEMTFVGNSPIGFNNIKYIPPLLSEELAKLLKQYDIFITASTKDPCSNSLIEALHCGLPALGYNDGGHPEIIGNAGETFRKMEEIPKLLEKITNKYVKYQDNIKLPSINVVGDKYYKFIKFIYDECKYNPKEITKIKFIKMMFYLLKYKTINKLSFIFR